MDMLLTGQNTASFRTDFLEIEKSIFEAKAKNL